MTKFNKCPNCGTTNSSSLLGRQFYIYECKDCKHLYCNGSRCGNGRCPECGSKDKREVGYVN